MINSFLIFLGALLAIRSYDKITYSKNKNNTEQEPPNI